MICLAAACDRVVKPVSEEELLKRELQSIDWKKVDELPSIATCDSLTDKQARQQCFFDVLSATIQEKLNSDTLKAPHQATDTLMVLVTINPDATVEFEPQSIPDSTAYPINLDSILHARLDDFPKVKPAIKRGMPVKTQFTLPVVIQKP